MRLGLCVLIGAVAGAAPGRLARSRPQQRSSVGVLVHGFDLGADDWPRVVWGSPRHGRLGRVPHGLLLASRLDACVVVLGSGGTEDASGVSEAKFTREMALAQLEELSSLPSSDTRDSCDVRKLRRMLTESVLLEDARNTADELRAAREIFRVRRIQTVVLVSSPTHAPRCVRDAARIFHGAEATDSPPGSERGNSGAYRPTILVSPCDTDFAEGEGGAVVIEPAHRSDRPTWLDDDGGRLSLHRLASRALKLAGGSPAKNGSPARFHVDLDAMLSRHERRKEREERARPPEQAAGPRRVQRAVFGRFNRSGSGTQRAESDHKF